MNGIEVLADKFATVGIDDSVRYFESGKYISGKAHKLKSQPKGIHHSGDLTAVATLKSVLLMSGGDVVLHETNLDFEGSCVAISPDKTTLAVGDSTNNNVHVYDIESAGIVAKKKLALTGAVTDVSFSPDGKYLVTADANRKVTLFTTGDFEKPNTREWGFHTAKVNCLSWSPDSLFVCSGGLDCSLIVWSVKSPEKHLILNSAHVQSQITGVKWIDNQTVASCGQDGNVKIWEVDWKN